MDASRSEAVGSGDDPVGASRSELWGITVNLGFFSLNVLFSDHVCCIFLDHVCCICRYLYIYLRVCPPFQPFKILCGV